MGVVLLDQRPDRLGVVLLERLELDQLQVAPSRERRVGIEHVGDPAAHARREVPSRLAQHDDASAGHVLAAVVADAFDDGVRAGVAHREALARPAAEERLARDRPVQDGVADDHVVLGGERRLLGRPHGDHAARGTLAGVVVGVAEQRQLDARRQPGPERLPGRPAELEPDRAGGQPRRTVLLRDVVGEQAPDRAVDVADRELPGDRRPPLDRRLRPLDQLPVERAGER